MLRLGRTTAAIEILEQRSAAVAESYEKVEIHSWDCMGFRRAQREADSQRARSVAENGKAEDKSALRLAKVKLHDQYHRGELH